MKDSPGKGEELFWQLADGLLREPGVTRGAMMGYPCLRSDGAFFACVERRTGNLVAKLPGPRVRDLVAAGRAMPFAPNGRIFKEWAAFPVPDRKEWGAVLDEARQFVSGEDFERL
jgi:hypothetical protein